jgi:hypothetical protein
MIAYDLRCSRNHQFEAWFKNLRTFEAQKEEGLIECPHCGSAEIDVVYSALSIGRSSLKEPSRDTACRSRRIETFLAENFEDVGRDFAQEARRVHRGESEARNIMGETTPGEEKMLRREGVVYFKIARPKPPN